MASVLIVLISVVGSLAVNWLRFRLGLGMVSSLNKSENIFMELINLISMIPRDHEFSYLQEHGKFSPIIPEGYDYNVDSES